MRLAGLDQHILQWINGFVGLNASFDSAVRVLADWNFGRSFWLGAVILWAWFRTADRDVRLKIVSGTAGLLVATGLARLTQALLPLHARPFNFITELQLKEPLNLDVHWGAASSFPSDTATLHFALAAIVASLSRRLGIAAFVWVTLIVSLPRIYILYHWPSDVLGGIVLGAGMVALFQHYRSEISKFSQVLTLERLEPQVFYPVMFALVYQIVDSFAAVEMVQHQLGVVSQWLMHTSTG